MSGRTKVLWAVATAMFLATAGSLTAVVIRSHVVRGERSPGTGTYTISPAAAPARFPALVANDHPNPRQGRCGREIIQDWFSHGRVDRAYRLDCFAAALGEVRSGAFNNVRQAISAAYADQADIKNAMFSFTGRTLGFAGLFPKAPKTTSRVIHGGGSYPGIRVPGTCTTIVQPRSNGDAIVKFVESWDASRLRASGAGQRHQLSHTWELTVSAHVLGGDKVVESREYGDPAPQSAV